MNDSKVYVLQWSVKHDVLYNGQYCIALKKFFFPIISMPYTQNIQIGPVVFDGYQYYSIKTFQRAAR